MALKKHISIDMQSALINHVAITPANVTDGNGLKHILPNSGEVYANKGYCDQQTTRLARARQVYLCSIKKNTMKDKIKDQDQFIIKFITKMRCPYETTALEMNIR